MAKVEIKESKGLTPLRYIWSMKRCKNRFAIGSHHFKCYLPAHHDGYHIYDGNADWRLRDPLYSCWKVIWQEVSSPQRASAADWPEGLIRLQLL
jgi:hypothetical protein